MMPLSREDAQGLVEYALILVLVAMVVIVLVAVMGETVAEVYCGIMDVIGRGPGPACP